MKILNELAKEGGYVCATIYPYDGCLVGRVAAHSEILFKVGPSWKNARGQVIMKTIKLQRPV